MCPYFYFPLWRSTSVKKKLPVGGELIMMVRNNQIYYIHNDHLGRPEAVTNAVQSSVWRANNYAFDRTVLQDNIGGLSLGFPGQIRDDETGCAKSGRERCPRHTGGKEGGGVFARPVSG